MDSSKQEQYETPIDRMYNVEEELKKIKNEVEDTMALFWDIRLFLDLGEELETILAFITQHPN